MLRVDTSTFLDEVDSSYFNEKMTSIEIYAKNVNLPIEPTYFNNVSKIRLVNCRLSTPPPSLSNYSMLVVLDLCENKLTDFPSNFFESFPKLSSLDISSNKLKNLNCKLPSTLTTLNVSYNESLDINSIWKQYLPLLTTLRASFCNIDELPCYEELDPTNDNLDSNSSDDDYSTNSSLPVFASSLTSLNLDGNNLTHIPPILSHFSELEDLSLYGNMINQIDPISFSHPLRSLNISYNKLEDQNKVNFTSEAHVNSLTFSANIINDFPISLFNISDIKILSLLRIGLNGIIDVEFPQSLIAIDLSHNKITSFSEKCIRSMKNLLALNISFNNINELPDAFSIIGTGDEKFHLSKFFADHNRISNIPTSLLSSNFMEQFSVSNNKIHHLGQFRWPKLKMFNVSFNHLKELPDAFESSSLLQEVNVSFNEFESLPKSFSHCRKMTSFIASYNNFISVPQCVMAFSQLKTLSLSGNKLTTLPKGFASFFFLRFLDLSNNNFSIFPSQIANIRSIWFLSLSHNCLTEIPFPSETPETGNESDNDKGIEIENIFPPELRLLDLSFNKLKKFEIRRGTMQKLQSLSLDFNMLSIDELEFENLKNVQFLSVSCNASKTPLIDILSKLLAIPTLTHFEYINNDIKNSVEVPLRVHILDDSRCSVTRRFSVGYSATMGDRPSMEDSIGIEEFDNDHAIFIVCDGHSGPVASATASKCLCCEFRLINDKCKLDTDNENNDNNCDVKIAEYVQNSFQKINNLLKSMNINDGCTAALAYIREKTVYAAGIGDSRIVRVRKKSFERMTVDAKPYNREEYDRLRGEGLKVSSDGRINKKLAVARALGDFWCDDGLFVLPEVRSFQITGKDKIFSSKETSSAENNTITHNNNEHNENGHNDDKADDMKDSNENNTKDVNTNNEQCDSNDNKKINLDNNIEENNNNNNEGEDDDIGLIIACDGLWDVISDERAAEIVRESKTGADAAVKLKNFAFSLQSKDNISVIVILFHPQEENQCGMSAINTVDTIPAYEDPEDEEDSFLNLPALQGRRRR